MGLEKIEKTGSGVLLGLWKLTEEVHQLESMIQLCDSESATYSTFRFEGRKKEWLAVRILLKQMLGCYVPISYLPSGKPYIDGFNIGVSHTKGYVCVTVSDRPTAVDIEYVSSRADKNISRFVSEKEMALLDSEQYSVSVLLIWSAKEVLFKLYDRSEVVFNRDLYVEDLSVSSQGTFKGGICHQGFCDSVRLSYLVTDDFVLVYC
jgi:4'-phosphopantetheinyl transferase EntD